MPAGEGATFWTTELILFSLCWRLYYSTNENSLVCEGRTVINFVESVDVSGEDYCGDESLLGIGVEAVFAELKDANPLMTLQADWRSIVGVLWLERRRDLKWRLKVSGE